MPEYAVVGKSIPRADGAEKVTGVVGVYRAADLPFAEPESGNRKRDFMARDRALYHGHPVVAIVAETSAAAEGAVALVEVEYPPQAAAVDTRASRAGDAPRARGEKPVEESAEAAM